MTDQEIGPEDVKDALEAILTTIGDKRMVASQRKEEAVRNLHDAQSRAEIENYGRIMDTCEFLEGKYKELLDEVEAIITDTIGSNWRENLNEYIEMERAEQEHNTVDGDAVPDDEDLEHDAG